MSHELVTLPDLTSCDREPITRLDRIQNFGFLIALANDWTVVRASANLGVLLGIEAGVAIGANFAAMIDASAQLTIRQRLRRLHSTDSERLFGIRLVADRPLLDINLHVVGDIIVIEGELSGGDGTNEATSLVATMMAKLGRTPALDSFHHLAARQVRELSGFDRVMVYRFDPAGNGEVIAETTGPRVESFLGLHYPASDIPQQARALLLRNPFRIIADVGEIPVALLPAEAANVPALDLSQSITRAQSRVHVEYLANMGVSASLSISIIVGGELWGLFACHHLAPRLPSFAARTAAELFGGMYSLALESRLGRIAAATETHAHSLTERLMTGVVADEKRLSNPEWLHAILSEIIDHDGLAIFRDGQVFSLGTTPSDNQVTEIAQHLNLTSPSRVFVTDNLLSLSIPDAADPAKAAGVLSIPISRSPCHHILLFRREWLQSIQWGGEPGKFSSSDDPTRLSPRKSFAAFSETIRGKSRPFSNSDRRLGEAARRALVEVMLRVSAASIVTLADQLQKASRRHKQLIDGVKDYAIYWLDAAGRVESWNFGAETMTGYAEAEIVGARYSLFFTESDRAAGEPERILASTLRDGKFIGEGWRVRKDGTTFWSEVSVEAVYNNAGVLIGFTKVSRDVTERRESESGRRAALEQRLRQANALREANRLLLMAEELSGAGHWRLDVASNTLFWSDVVCAIHGRNPGYVPDLEGGIEAYHPDDRAAVQYHVEQAIAMGTPFEFEARIIRTDGVTRRVISRGRTEVGPDGSVVAMFGVIQDITEAGRQQQALVASEERYELTIKAMSVGVWDWDITNSSFYGSSRLFEIVGHYNVKSTSDFSVFVSLMHPDDREANLASIQQHLDHKHAYDIEYRIRHARGHYIWLHATGQAIWNAAGKPHRMCGSVLDITDFKRQQQALVASEEKYELALKGMSVGVWDWDIVNNHLYWSEKLLEIVGMNRELARDPVEFFDRLHPDDKAATEKKIWQHLNKRTVYDIEYRLRHARGHYVWVRVMGQAIWNEAGEPRRMSGSAADITDFKRQQKALIESEETFRRAIENAVVGNVLMAPDGRWLTVNRAFCQLVGYAEADLLRAGTALIQDPGEPWNLQETVEDLMSGTATVVEGERRLLHCDGYQLWVNVSVSLVTRDGGAKDYLVIQFQDLTERKRTEIMKDEFVSTVSHELRTPLTSLFGSLRLLGASTAGKLDAKSERLLEVAQISSTHLTGLVNDILDIEKIAAGKLDYQMRTLAAQPLIAEIIDRHASLANLHKITFNTQLDVEGLAICVDPGRFNQALLNLLSNAAKYSPAGDQVDIVAKREGDAAIRISVTDHGPGIPEAFRARIFGRFAQADSSTTRKVGGTGLGLNITKTLIEAFGGTVSFDSVEGQGATFHFVLPTSELIAPELELEAHD